METLFLITSIAFFLIVGLLVNTVIFDPHKGSRLITDSFRKTLDNETKIEQLTAEIEKLKKQLDALKNFTYATRSSNKKKDS